MNDEQIKRLGSWIGRFHIYREIPESTNAEQELAGIPIFENGVLDFIEWAHETVSPPDMDTIRAMSKDDIVAFRYHFEKADFFNDTPNRILKETLISLFPEREADIIAAIQNAIGACTMCTPEE